MAFSVSDGEAALAIAERLLTDPATPAIWRQRRERLLAEEQDLVPWMIDEIESFEPAHGRLPYRVPGE